jgi:pyrrolidone-carboxylate peptidase
MKVVLTGFEPFEGENVNPSLEAVNQLDEIIAGAQIVKAQLPTVFGKAIERVQKILTQERPDVMICIGQAKERVDIRVERVAINLDDARIPIIKENSPLTNEFLLMVPMRILRTCPRKRWWLRCGNRRFRRLSHIRPAPSCAIMSCMVYFI